MNFSSVQGLYKPRKAGIKVNIYRELYLISLDYLIDAPILRLSATYFKESFNGAAMDTASDKHQRRAIVQ